MGAMPFAIVTMFDKQDTGIATVKNDKNTNGKIYNLNGQVVDENYKGVVIINGKKIIKR